MSRPMVLLLTAAALLVLSGCGIYQVVTLDAPLSGGFSSSDGTFTIRVTDAVAVGCLSRLRAVLQVLRAHPGHHRR